MKILIVDDNEENLYLLKVILENSGFKVLEAENGQSALMSARAELPGLIISDILMPVMDGYSFCAECKKDKKLKNIPFIFYTATYTNPNDEALAYHIGADRFVLKPKDADELLKIIHDVLSEARNKVDKKTSAPAVQETTVIREYNQALVRKLEDKMLQAEKAEARLKIYTAKLEEEIRQHHTTEEMLRKSEERFHSFYDNAIFGFYRTTPGGKILLANDSLLKMLGFSSFEELAAIDLNKAGYDTSTPRTEFLELIEAQGELKAFESKWICRDGSIIHVRESVKAIRDESGKTLCYDGIVEDITEHKLTERALVESRNLFATLAHSSPIGIFKTTPEGYTTYVNQRWCELSGLSFEKALGDGWFTAVHPDDRAKLKEHWDSDVSERHSSAADYRFIHPDGSVVWVNGLAVPEIVDGKAVGYVGTISDVTERMLYEERLRVFSRAVEQSPVSIVLADASGKITYVNPRYEQITGYSQAEAKGRLLRELDPTRTRPEIVKAVQEALNNGEIWYSKTRNVKKDGKNFWESVSISRITDNKNQVTHYLSIKEDITEQKDLVSKLSEIEAQLQIVADTTSAVLYRFMFETRKFEYMNPTIINVTGYSAEEINEMGFGRIIEKIDSAGGPIADYETYLRNRQDEKNEYQADFLIKNKNGGTRWLTDRSFPWQLEGKGSIGAVGILTDITHRKEAEKELILAKEKAEEMNKLKSNLLANMSHELRTPLISIMGFSELIEEEEDGSETIKRMARSIYLGGVRLLNTLNNLLQFSKIESEQTAPRISDINIHSLLSTLTEEYETAAKLKGLKIIKSFNEVPFTLKSDRMLLQEIFSNLVQNAIKFTQQGTIEISTAVERKLLLVSVKDTGIGIPAQYQNLIFEPFRQVSEGMGRSYEGAGLGLTITSKFVKLLHGEIRLESDGHSGTTFTVILPCDFVS